MGFYLGIIRRKLKDKVKIICLFCMRDRMSITIFTGNLPGIKDFV